MKKMTFKRWIALLGGIFLLACCIPCLKAELTDGADGIFSHYMSYHPIFVGVVTVCQLLLLRPWRRSYLRVIGLALTVLKTVVPGLLLVNALRIFQSSQALSSWQVYPTLFVILALGILEAVLYVREAIHIRKTWGQEEEDHRQYP